MKVTYSKAGPCYPDHSIVQTAEDLYHDGKDVTTSTFLLIDAFRLLVARGVPAAHFTFYLEDVEIGQVNESGRLGLWPAGFGDGSINILREISTRERARYL